MQQSVEMNSRKFIAILPASTLLASLFGVILNISLPFVLEISEYAKYSLTLGFSQLVSALLFEWLRISIVRHYHVSSDLDLAKINATIWNCYGHIVVALLLVSGVAFAVASLNEVAVLVGLIAGGAAFQAMFDARQAEDRVLQQNGRFAVRAIVRAALSLSIGLVVAAVTGSGLAVVLSFIAIYPLVSIDYTRRFSFPSLRGGSLQAVKFLAGFGFPAALGTNLAVATPNLVRTIIVTSLGLQTGGVLLLTLDLSQRVFSTLGTAINTVTVPNAIRSIRENNPEAAKRRIADQLSVFVLVCGLAALTAIELLKYSQMHYEISNEALWAAIALLLSVFAMNIRQYSVDPTFTIANRTKLSPWGAIFTLLSLSLFFILTVIMPNYAQILLILGLCVSSTIGLLASLAMLVKLENIELPVQEAIAVCVCFILGAIIVSILPAQSSLAWTALNIGAITAAFSSCAVALNVMRTRTVASRLFRHVRKVV